MISDRQVEIIALRLAERMSGSPSPARAAAPVPTLSQCLSLRQPFPGGAWRRRIATSTTRSPRRALLTANSMGSR